MADLPPRVTRIIMASFAMAATSLALVAWCFTHTGGPFTVAGLGVALGGASAGAIKLALR